MAKVGDILLTQGIGNFLSEGIQFFEHGCFSHSAIVSGNNKIIEATPNGVIENEISYERYAIFEVVNITDEQRQKVIDFAKSQIGTAYDYLQDVGFALNGIRELIGLNRISELWDEHGKVVCSALVDMSFRNGSGIILRSDRICGDITPQGIAYSTKIRLIENHNLWEL